MINSTQTTSTQSYSRVVSNFQFPKKEQAIVFDTIEGVKVDEYIYAITEKTSPDNIIAASKITQNRFCCYLKNATLVDELTREGNNVLEICGTKITIRPYVARLKRVIFSNVHPCIPHDVIIDKLKDYNVFPKSNVTFMKIGINKDGYSHILCFRRQLFVSPEDIDKIPSDISISYDSTTYHIYVTTDKMVCFLCKAEGHTTKYCPQNKQRLSQQSQNAELSQIPLSPTVLNKDDFTLPVDDKDLDINDARQNNDYASNTSITVNREEGKKETQQTTLKSNTMDFNGQALFVKPTNKNLISKKESNKRPLSVTSDSTTEPEHQVLKKKETSTLLNSKKKKKTKGLSTADIKQQIEIAGIEIANSVSATFPIKLEELIDFMSDTLDYPYGASPDIATKYTSNQESLVIMLKEVYKHISERALKTRITKIANALMRPMETDEKSKDFSTDNATSESDAEV